MIAGKRSDNSTARQLAPQNAVVVDNSNIARSRSPTNISFGPLKSVKQKREHRSSSSFVYVSTHRNRKLVSKTGRFNDDIKLVPTGGASCSLQDLSGFNTLRFIMFGRRLEAADARIKPEAYLRLGDVFVGVLVLESVVFEG